MKQGKYRSVRAAAIGAGIVDPLPLATPRRTGKAKAAYLRFVVYRMTLKAFSLNLARFCAVVADSNVILVGFAQAGF